VQSLSTVPKWEQNGTYILSNIEKKNSKQVKLKASSNHFVVPDWP
jgi:hypothetical protein